MAPMFTQDWDFCIGRALMLINYLGYNLPCTMGRLKKISLFHLLVLAFALFQYCRLCCEENHKSTKRAKNIWRQCDKF